MNNYLITEQMSAVFKICTMITININYDCNQFEVVNSKLYLMNLH